MKREGSGFAARVIDWQRRCGRHDLPWQGTKDPYRIWLSEVMLQQTQVATVIPYYRRFVERFPDVSSLARASVDDVLALWSGLGYYSRGRNLHDAARQVMDRHGGRFPHDADTLESLPGIGRSTAAAIAVFAGGAHEAILDGNVKRVLARCFAIDGYPGEARVQQQLWKRAESLLPARDIERYTQGLMDLGATVCTRAKPSCTRCPVIAECAAHRLGRITELPAPRPQKVLPHRRTTMALVLGGGKVLLQKRPPTGVWAGLLSFPEFSSPAEAIERLPLAFGMALESHRSLEPLRHGFTHYLLTIEPLLCKPRREPAFASDGGCVWLPLEQALLSAIPAPVRTLLHRLRGMS